MDVCEAWLVPTAAAEAMKSLITTVQPALKKLGYRRRRSTFNRTVQPDSLVHVINFQMGPFDPPGTVEIPGLRPSLYGRFTINLGVWIPGIPEPGFPSPKDRTGKIINEYNCHIRIRLGHLLPEQADTWWRLDVPADALASDISEAISMYALPWLSRFTDWDDTLHQLETAPAVGSGLISPPRPIAMSMRQARGEHAEV